MKRSRKIEIALVAGLAMSGCGRRAYDPCAPQSFNEPACQDAISHNGYYYGGRWYSHSYSGRYSSYYDSYNSYVRRGGSVTSVPSSVWTRPSPQRPSDPGASTPDGSAAGSRTSSGDSGSGASSGESSVSRGMFGSSAHSGGGGGE